jgi:hypothetical protein
MSTLEAKEAARRADDRRRKALEREREARQVIPVMVEAPRLLVEQMIDAGFLQLDEDGGAATADPTAGAAAAGGGMAADRHGKHMVLSLEGSA